MKIISFKSCPFVQHVTAMLEVKNIPYEVEFIQLNAKPQWFLDISPNSQVPLLITDEDHVLFESIAIVEYLDEVYPALQQNISAEERAENRAWMYLASKNYLVQCSAQRSADNTTLLERSKKLGSAFDKIEKKLTDSLFFKGDTIGMVDIAWLVLLHRADIIEKHSGYDFIGKRPKLKSWQKRLLATGLAEKSVPLDFSKVFSNLYLSDDTILGRGFENDTNCTKPALKSGTCC